MIALRRNAEHLARLFSYACAHDAWIREYIKPSPDAAALEACVQRMAWDGLFLLQAAEGGAR